MTYNDKKNNRKFWTQASVSVYQCAVVTKYNSTKNLTDKNFPMYGMVHMLLLHSNHGNHDALLLWQLFWMLKLFDKLTI